MPWQQELNSQKTVNKAYCMTYFNINSWYNSCRMLNNLAEGKMSCDMIYNFRQLIEHELCVARKTGIFEGENFSSVTL